MHPYLLSILMFLCGSASIPSDQMIVMDGMVGGYKAGDYYYVSEECYLANKYVPVTTVGDYGVEWYGQAVWWKDDVHPPRIFLNKPALDWFVPRYRGEPAGPSTVWAACVMVHEGWHIELRKNKEFPIDGALDHRFIYPKHLKCLEKHGAPKGQRDLIRGRVN